MNAIVDGFQNIVQSFSDAIFLAVIKDDRYQYLLDGLKMSLLLTVIAAGIGVVIGMLLAIAKLQDLDNLSGSRFMNGLRRWLAGFANGYISVVRGTPAVVQLMVIYFIIFGRLFQGVLEGYQVAALAFGINSGAYVAEIIRAGIMAVDKGQTEASRSLGLSGGKTMLFIVIPQAVKNVLPALGNEFVTVIKESSIVMTIGITELMFNTSQVYSSSFRYFESLIVCALIYFVMTFTTSHLLGVMERRMKRDAR